MTLMRDTTFSPAGLFGCCRQTLGAINRDKKTEDGDTVRCTCGTPMVLDARVWRWLRA
jgi:hypothetical protein